MGLYNNEPFSTLQQLDLLWSVATASVPFWLLLGGMIGMLIPRPRWLEASGKSGVMLYLIPQGLFIRRAFLFFHGAFVFREIWNYCTLPNVPTQSIWVTLGNLAAGRSLTDPSAQPKYLVPARRASFSTKRPEQFKSMSQTDEDNLDWYVQSPDLHLFKEKIEKEDNGNPNPWEPMMDKDYGNFTYTAWRQKLQDGKTDYKSVTVAKNATAEEFMDFYFDDITRMHWDSMISETEVLENGPSQHRCQVVRWIRKFPFSFISKREYVIARRMWKENGCLYGITKGIEHPRAVMNPEIVRMDVFYSMWRSRTIPDPDGGDQPACETVLLHHEEFKILENMARFAVKHGMAGFVKKLGPSIKHFVEERRKRVEPFGTDPDAFGVNSVPNPPTEAERMSETDDSISEMSLEDSEAYRPSQRALQTHSTAKQKFGLRKKAAIVAVAGAAAIVFGARRRRA